LVVCRFISNAIGFEKQEFNFHCLNSVQFSASQMPYKKRENNLK
jgi:hypothetical protein